MKRSLRTGRRDGVSLIELIVVMSAASIILSLSAGLIHRLMHAEMKARSLAAVERTSVRFSNLVRRDVHSASNALTDPSQLPDGVFLQLETSPSNRIEYRREGPAIHRLQLDHDRIIAREQFDFPSDFELESRAEMPRLVVLTLTSRNSSILDDFDEAIRRAKSFAIDLQVIAALRGGR